jgi:hypothetical protein
VFDDADNHTVSSSRDSAAPVIVARSLVEHGVSDDMIAAHLQRTWRLDLLDAAAAVRAAHVLVGDGRHQVALPREGSRSCE